MNINKIYFITGINTDIGKTFLVENLCRILTEKKIAVRAIKPIASGFNDDDLQSDSAKILSALGEKISKKNIDKITPWRFQEPISPHFAAKKSGKKINFLEVVKFCKKEIAAAKKNQEFLFIETAGGVMTPINDKKTFLNLAAELKIPTLLLSGNYLGSISQTLCALEALKNKKIFVEKIIVNARDQNSDKNISTIKNFSGIKTVELKEFFIEIKKITSK